MRRLIRNDLGMKAYKIQKHQLLTTQTKQKRLLRSKAMLLRFTGGLHKQIVFSDEKLFTVEQSLNKQNDRLLALSKDALPQDTFRVFRTQKPMSVMVWAGVTSTGRTPLVFVPQRVKINQSAYRAPLLPTWQYQANRGSWNELSCCSQEICCWEGIVILEFKFTWRLQRNRIYTKNIELMSEVCVSGEFSTCIFGCLIPSYIMSSM